MIFSLCIRFFFQTVKVYGNSISGWKNVCWFLLHVSNIDLWVGRVWGLGLQKNYSDETIILPDFLANLQKCIHKLQQTRKNYPEFGSWVFTALIRYIFMGFVTCGRMSLLQDILLCLVFVVYIIWRDLQHGSLFLTAPHVCVRE